MTKRRITVSLDEDVVEMLAAVRGRNVSATVNDALREALAADAHRAAALDWLADLNEKYGTPTQEQYDAADKLLDEIEGRDTQRRSAA